MYCTYSFTFVQCTFVHVQYTLYVYYKIYYTCTSKLSCTSRVKCTCTSSSLVSVLFISNWNLEIHSSCVGSIRRSELRRESAHVFLSGVRRPGISCLPFQSTTCMVGIESDHEPLSGLPGRHSEPRDYEARDARVVPLLESVRQSQSACLWLVLSRNRLLLHLLRPQTHLSSEHSRSSRHSRHAALHPRRTRNSSFFKVPFLSPFSFTPLHSLLKHPPVPLLSLPI